LRLVHIVEFPQSVALNAAGFVRRALAEEVRTRRSRLQQLAASPALEGIVTRIAVREDSPVVDGLVREVLAHRPRLLVAQTHRHGVLARFWLSNTDWELIRHCPCPCGPAGSRCGGSAACLRQARATRRRYRPSRSADG
jgi:hypothetical protein